MTEPQPTNNADIVDFKRAVIEGTRKYNSWLEILGEIRRFLYTEGQLTSYQYEENYGPQLSRLPDVQVINTTRTIISRVISLLDTDERIETLSNSTSSIFQKKQEVLATITEIRRLIGEFEETSKGEEIEKDKKQKKMFNTIVSILNKLTYLNSRIDELQKLIVNQDNKQISEKGFVSDEPSL